MKMTRFARELRAHARAEMAAFELLDCCPECLLLLTDATVRGKIGPLRCLDCGGGWWDPAAARWLRECFGIVVMEQAA